MLRYLFKLDLLGDTRARASWLAISAFSAVVSGVIGSSELSVSALPLLKLSYGLAPFIPAKGFARADLRVKEGRLLRRLEK
jgi:hypothetical protein